MLQRREATLDWMSQQVYRVIPLVPGTPADQRPVSDPVHPGESPPLLRSGAWASIGRSDPPDEDHVSVVFV